MVPPAAPAAAEIDVVQDRRRSKMNRVDLGALIGAHSAA
jgi:hypothetical protein